MSAMNQASSCRTFLNYAVHYIKVVPRKHILCVERSFYSYATIESAEKEMRSYKRRGIDAWVVDRNGNQVPVKGALKPIKGLSQLAPYVITCMCGLVNPTLYTDEAGLDRCMGCDCH